ncbi:MAG: branched-chain amino acid aminotransferase [Bdellovibrionaceae bacterium]|nr:branched-chain amino acid aminotransferase [Pseudobdellovibrionaceae bacterium]
MSTGNYSFSMTKTSNPLSKPPPNTALGFGKYFTDHIAASDYSDGKWHTHRIVPYSNLSMDPAACVYHYGQALFEGLKAFRQKNDKIVIFRPQFNASRMAHGCQRLSMQAPPEDLFIQTLAELVSVERDWVPTERGSALYIRPTLVGTEGFLGVRPSNEYLFFTLLSPVGSYYSNNHRSVRIWVETEHVRAAPGGLGAVKAAANYASSLYAASEQKKRGYDQVLWLDAVTKDQIEEVGTMNVFFVFKNEIVTPALNGSILPGGVRECVLHLLREWKLPVSERKITMSELKEQYARGEFLEMFGTGTAAVITPVGELQHKDFTYKLNTGGETLSTRLYEEITKIQYGDIPDRHQWLMALDK